VCLLLIAHDAHPDYRLLVAANRDEFHARPSLPANRWLDPPGILGGRDLESGGTWLALHEGGRFAAVTNVRSGRGVRRGARSRGLIVTDFLTGDKDAPAFAMSLASNARDYDGFNLLVHDGLHLTWYSNQADTPRTLGAGIYTLSNAELDTRWPKTERLRSGFDAAMSGHSGDPVSALFEVLRDAKRASDDLLPDTGVGRDMESTLSSIFIEGSDYGTRCSTILTIDRDGHARFCERRYDSSGHPTGDSGFEIELADTAA
jgi:uncharacterized protein with NRDE domain